MSILFIMPHPDDEAFAVSGTIRRLVQEGNTVSLAVVTDGAAGKDSREKPREKSLTMARHEETKTSADILGITKVHFLDYVDGTLANRDLKNGLVTQLVDIIHKEKPEVVITLDHTGVYWHVDHVVTSLATSLAVHQSLSIVDKLFFFVPPNDFKISYNYSTAARFPITHRVAISSVAKFKNQSIDAHKSQSHDKEKYLKFLGKSTLASEDYYLAIDNGRDASIFALFEAI